ncbi:hypothetical protein F2Q69_00048991 [Brassica cretica]|uniref:Uncharacterized protein n=1 Tax=Brassica cretica TaxID=69181 RepID=A0A8S9Q402_BRACR|nr:hypothetical protein F2Q69_00048991 [Brassica cretica]
MGRRCKARALQRTRSVFKLTESTELSMITGGKVNQWLGFPSGGLQLLIT